MTDLLLLIIVISALIGVGGTCISELRRQAREDVAERGTRRERLP